ncbi:Tyrosine kinase catalytic domain protein [Ceratobasidium sp. AG-Ba]|nr:Tyrosine kinase catalytic domain protein [Ceratobasidium sp. AG-Ba]
MRSYNYKGFDRRYVSPWPICIFYQNHDLDLYRRNKNISYWERAKLLRDIISGLCHIHRERIVHGDIKAANVLIDNSHIPKICDFGSSRVDCSCPADTLLCNGTSQWSSPELLEDGVCTKESDIWAFGCLALEVQFDKYPYNLNPTLAYLSVLKGLPPAELSSAEPVIPGSYPESRVNTATPTIKAEDSYSRRVWSIMQKCWEFDPEDRPDAEELLIEFNR